jgi:hypothetical protein
MLAIPPVLKLIAGAAVVGGSAAYANKALTDGEILDTWRERSTWNANTLALNDFFEKVNANLSSCGPTWDQYHDGFRSLWKRWHVFYDAEGNRSWLGGDPSEQSVKEAVEYGKQLSDYLGQINESVRYSCPDKAGDLNYPQDLPPIDLQSGRVEEQQKQQTKIAIEAAKQQSMAENVREGKDPLAPRPPPVDWGSTLKNAGWLAGGVLVLWGATLGYRIYKGN